jgi:hypothetical protein
MATEFDVVQDPASGRWQVREGGQVLIDFERLEEAVAHARAVLLERDKGSMTVYTPSGRPREKLNLRKKAGRKTIQLA